jgi:hypothetical protein
MTCMHPRGHKGLPFSVGGPSLQNANVDVSCLTLLPRLRELQVIAKFCSMMENGAHCCNARQEWAGHNEVSGPSVPLHAV